MCQCNHGTVYQLFQLAGQVMTCRLTQTTKLFNVYIRCENNNIALKGLLVTTMLLFVKDAVSVILTFNVLLMQNTSKTAVLINSCVFSISDTR